MRSHLVQHRVQVHLVAQLIDDYASLSLIDHFEKHFMMCPAHRHGRMLTVRQDFGQSTDHFNLTHS